MAKESEVVMLKGKDPLTWNLSIFHYACCNDFSIFFFFFFPPSLFKREEGRLWKQEGGFPWTRLRVEKDLRLAMGLERSRS